MGFSIPPTKSDQDNQPALVAFIKLEAHNGTVEFDVRDSATASELWHSLRSAGYAVHDGSGEVVMLAA